MDTNSLDEIASRLGIDLRGSSELYNAIPPDYEFPFNPRGHLLGRGRPIKGFDVSMRIGPSDRLQLAEAWEKDVLPLDQSIALEPRFEDECTYCGDVVSETDGQKIWAKEACAYPEGITVEFELNVPSGRLVIANDLRPDFDILGSYNVNTRLGCAQTTYAMAKIGCAHAYVGNSCPDVYRVGPDQFVVAIPAYDEFEPLPFEGERVAGIDTDLWWWYSMVDGG